LSSDHEALFEGLPGPAAGALTVYVFGPGFGESQVVALPDGKWVVVDACKLGEAVLPLELLRHFDVPAIDLLVVTHADLDHYRGLPELIGGGLPVRRLWRFPGFTAARDIIVELEKEQADPDFAEMLRMYDAMVPLMRSARGVGREVAYDTMPWSGAGRSYSVHCVAPCSADKMSAGERVAALYKRVKAGYKLEREEKRRLMGVANRLSLAIVVWWGTTGILLGGDVEHDPANAASGWRGVIANLEEDELLPLIQGLRFVKAAHHGSARTFSAEAWAEHARGGAVELAVVTRFNHGPNPPPHAAGLAPILRHARKLALTSQPAAGWPLVTGAGWIQVAHPTGPGAGACVAVTLSPDPPATVALSAQAALFERPAPPAPAPGAAGAAVPVAAAPAAAS
jgi:hypothetical protein